MQKYKFEVKEVSYGAIEIEADNIDEAREKAEREYVYGNCFWYDSEVEYNGSTVDD